MPSKNRVKVYIPEAYYHIYNRGSNKQKIFRDNQDYSVFLNLLKRYLSGAISLDNNGRPYDSLNTNLELLAFCLMPNHFHLLVYQIESDSMTKLLRRVSTAYTMYFNRKYKRNGSLFQERFKASLITRDEYLHHISRYIHLNPDDYQDWEFSSYGYYINNWKADWVKPQRIMELFGSTKEYSNFVANFKENEELLEELKDELADS